MIVCLDHSIGAYLISDEEINDRDFIKCDGSVIYRKDYPDFFEKLHIAKGYYKLPKPEYLGLPKELVLYVRVK